MGLSQDEAICPCSVMLDDNGIDRAGIKPQQFVTNNCYCDSGNPQCSTEDLNTYYTADPLWDGEGCLETNHCCNELGMPLFFKIISYSCKWGYCSKDLSGSTPS